MSEAEVTGMDMDCAMAIAAILNIGDEHVMPLAEFRAVTRHEAAEEARSQAIAECAKAACGSPNCGPNHVLDDPLRLWAECGATRLVRNGSVSENEIIRALLAYTEKPVVTP